MLGRRGPTIYSTPLGADSLLHSHLQTARPACMTKSQHQKAGDKGDNLMKNKSINSLQCISKNPGRSSDPLRSNPLSATVLSVPSLHSSCTAGGKLLTFSSSGRAPLFPQMLSPCR